MKKKGGVRRRRRFEGRWKIGRKRGGRRGRNEEKERRDGERIEEQERRRRKRRNVVWRGIEGEDQEERRIIVKMYMERALGRIVED